MKSEAGPGPRFPPLGNYRLKRSVGPTEALAPVITGTSRPECTLVSVGRRFKGSLGERRPPGKETPLWRQMLNVTTKVLECGPGSFSVHWDHPTCYQGKHCAVQCSVTPRSSS